MDGLFHGKPYFLIDDLGGKNPYSWKHPYDCGRKMPALQLNDWLQVVFFMGIPGGPTDLWETIPNLSEWENTNPHRKKIFAIIKRFKQLVPLKDDDKPVYLKNHRTRNAQHFKIPPVAPLISMGGYTSQLLLMEEIRLTS